MAKQTEQQRIEELEKDLKNLLDASEDIRQTEYHDMEDSVGSCTSCGNVFKCSDDCFFKIRDAIQKKYRKD